MKPALIAFGLGAVAMLALPAGPSDAALLPEPRPAASGSAAIPAEDILEVLACGPNCRQNRRVSRRTSRRTSRRVSHRHNYYGGGCCYDDHDNTAAVGIAAGIAGLAVGAAIASSANNAPPPAGSYP